MKKKAFKKECSLIDKNDLPDLIGINLQSSINLIRSMPGAVYLKDIQGKYLACTDDMWQEADLKSEKQLLGQTDYKLFPKKHADALRANDLAVIEQDRKILTEEVIQLPTGVTKYYQVAKSPLKNKKGIIIGIIGISTDITDRKKVEEKLRIAFAKAELANKAKTEFLENMRHDMRTALSGIQGFSELISSMLHKKQKSSNDGEVKNNKKIKIKKRNNNHGFCTACTDNMNNEAKMDEYVDSLVASCRALTHIHKQILHAIYACSGDIPIYENKFNAQGKIQEIVNLHLATAAEKGLQLQFKYDKKIPKYLTGDCKRLSAIALELVSNAFKYTNNGKILINVSKEGKRDGKTVIKFSVQDTGIGIPEERKTEIFTRFSRVNPSYEGKYIGLGLGLSVVKQFVSDIGGEIFVESKLNEGSTFTCYLPFAESLSKDNKNVDEGLSLPLPDMEIGLVPIRPVLKKKEMPTTLSAEKEKTMATILQVEDEEICILITEAMLKTFGFNVDIAHNGQEALQKYKEKHYDLVLMDVGLPDLSGIEVTRKIRVDEKTLDKHTPIVALTAHVDNESKKQCIEAGMDAVLSKPIASDKFSEILNAFLPQHASTTQINTRETKRAKPSKKDDRDLLKINSKIIDFELMEKNNTLSEADAKTFLKERAYPSLQENMQQFKRVYDKEDWDMIEKMAHKLSGACCSCCLMRLWEACKRLEIYLLGKKTKIRKELCEQVCNEFKAVQDAIKKF